MFLNCVDSIGLKLIVMLILTIISVSQVTSQSLLSCYDKRTFLHREDGFLADDIEIVVTTETMVIHVLAYSNPYHGNRFQGNWYFGL